MNPQLIAILVPGLVEITKEIISLFKSKKSNQDRHAAAKDFIRETYPDVSDHLENLLIELTVFAHKQGMNDVQAAKYIEGFLNWHQVWPKSGTVLASRSERAVE